MFLKEVKDGALVLGILGVGIVTWEVWRRRRLNTAVDNLIADNPNLF